MIIDKSIHSLNIHNSNVIIVGYYIIDNVMVIIAIKILHTIHSRHRCLNVCSGV